MPIPLRSDFDTVALRAIARRSKDGPQARRLLALAAIYDGGTRTEAARIGGVTLQIVRDWVLKFNAQGPESLIDRKPPGQPSRLTDDHRRHLAQMIEAGPIPAVHGVVRWRLIDLIQWLWDEHRVPISKQTLSREVRALGYRKLSARPRHHAKSEAAVEDFKKPFPRVWRRSRPYERRPFFVHEGLPSNSDEICFWLYEVWELEEIDGGIVFSYEIALVSHVFHNMKRKGYRYSESAIIVP